MSTTASLLTVLLSGISSGVVASYVGYRLNQRKDHALFMRQKAEVLFISAHRWTTFLATHFFIYYPVFRNEALIHEMEANEVARIEKKEATARGDDSRQVTMIVSIYFPELLKELDALHTVREELNGIIFSFKRATKKGGKDGRKWFAQFDSATGKLIETTKAFEDAIITAARKISS